MSADMPPSLYKSCTATDDDTAVITLTAPSAAFLGRARRAGVLDRQPEGAERSTRPTRSAAPTSPTFDGTFGTEHPIGTGPFKFDSWSRRRQAHAVRNDDYWGDKALLDKLIFKPIADGAARRRRSRPARSRATTWSTRPTSPA